LTLVREFHGRESFMPTTLTADEGMRKDRGSFDEARSSGVAWGAVAGGAFAAAAFYLILLALGAGFGLSAVSPWSNVGASASTVTTVAIAWLIFIEIVASALGGYLTGRMRTKWTLVHTDEVYFRDTANGFLAWAVALIFSATFLGSAAASMVGSLAPSDAGRQTASAATGSNPEAYFVDKLFRSDRVGPQNGDESLQTEAGRIFAKVLLQKVLLHSEAPAPDQAYLTHLVAARAGISESDAEKRVADVVSEARQAEDTARKVTAHLLLWSFLALLMGAFSASFAATVGGRQRDHMPAV
jgi:hypothetical protein